MKKAAVQPVPLPELEQLRREYRRIRWRSRYINLLKSTAGTVLVAAAAVVLAANLWLPVLRIVGSSMSPTLAAGDILLCTAGQETQPGQLMAFYVGNRLLVKRCIAGPDQWVALDEGGTVLVDGIPLAEPFGTTPPGETVLPCQVPREAWFCLGDNRETSVDSRHEAVGFVSRDQLLGRPVFRIWPLNRFGPVK